MPKAQTVEEVIDQVVVEGTSEQEKAVALHNYVRDNVKFGFNKYFDATPPDLHISLWLRTLQSQEPPDGHAISYSWLGELPALCGHIKRYLEGCYSRQPLLDDPARILSHSYVEVRVDGKWCTLDSYIVDTPLLAGAKARLADEDRSLGYGVRSDSINTWDGQGDAFSQFDQGMMIEDHGRIDDIEAYYQDQNIATISWDCASTRCSN